MMTHETTQYEESIDLLALAVKILRKWQWMLVVALMVALCFGMYVGFLRPVQVGSTAEIAKLQEELDENTAKLAESEAEFIANEQGIAERQKKIAANEELLVAQQQMQETLQENLSALRATLEQSQEVLANPNASSKQTAEVIAQLLTLTNEITSVDDQLSAAAQSVSNTKKDTSTLQSEIDKMTASNETLGAVNEELRAEIKVQKTEMGRLTRSAGVGKVALYTVVGAMIGAFFYCGIVFLQFMMDKKLRSGNELKEQYGIHILGEFWSEAAKTHNTFGRKLDRIVGDVQTLPQEQQVYKLIAAGIQMPEFPLPMQLAVTGTARKETLRTVGQQLRAMLPKGYKITVAANPVYAPALLVNLKQYTVLLVEEKGFSDKREIAKLAELLSSNEVQVIGAVVK